MNAVLRMLPCAEFGRVLAETPGAAFEGIWVPLVTPFRDGRVDLDAAQRLATHLVDNGVHGLVVCGTSGEAATLNEMEQKDLLRAVLDAVGSRCPVLVGISESDTREAVNKASRMQRYGIAGFLVSAPPYIRPSQQGLLLHFQSIAAAADRPIVLYNIPQRTGVNIELDTIKALVDNPRFVAIKECGGNPQTLKRLISETPLKVLSGEDTLTFITLGLGGHGAISAAAHIRPDLYVRMYELVKAGEIERARVIFDTLLPLIRYLFSEPNPAPVKAALALQGWISEELRLPMTPVTDVCKAKLRASLESVNTFRG
jgi:4-hydroxy-tetrahydrodipicolinate synthase